MTLIAFAKPLRSFCVLSSVLLLTAAGCAAGSEDEQRIAQAIKEHYAAYATEEGGTCRSPKIDSVQEHRLLETTTDGFDVMMVRYSYFDRHADMDANWERLVYLSQPCGGIAERQFVLARSEFGYRVMDMDGELRNKESTP